MSKKAKGFGQSPTPTRKFKDFLLAFGDFYRKNSKYETKLQQFFKANINKLDDLLLDALPLVFTSLIADKSIDEREKIACLFENFAVTIYKFPLGDRATNLELSITAHNLSLKIYTRENSPARRAGTLNNLANAYKDRIWGDRAENLERAIELYGQALEVYTRENFPVDRARTLHNLANAYQKRIRGDRAENLERAIKLCEQVLEVYTREDFPVARANTLRKLANAYGDRIWSDRSDNLEKAIELCEQALQIYRPDNFPEYWARSQHNLANVYRNRVLGDREQNLEQAIDLYNQAARIFTRSAFPARWAGNQGDLAEALMQRDNPGDLDTAIALLQEALEVSPAGCQDFIDFQYRLGIALSQRYDRDKNFDDLRQALVAYKTALDLISPEHYDRKDIWKALPTTQTILGSRLVRDGEWQQGLQLLLNSVNQLSTSDDRLAHANALYHTGRAYEVLSDREKARLYYRDALRWYEYLQDLPGIAKSRTGLGNVFVSQGHLEKGMEELDRAKAIYQQLPQTDPDKVEEIDIIYQASRRAIERQTSEVYL